MDGPLYCVEHTTVETRLRCNKCGRPICTRCAVRTPVGYRCKKCISAQQRAFYAGFQPGYYLVAGVVALPLSLLAGWLIPRLGWYTVFLGPVVGGGIAEAARWAIGRKRGEYTWLVVCGSIVVGAFPVLLTFFLPLAGRIASASSIPVYSTGRMMQLIWFGVYLVTATGSAYARLRVGAHL